MDYDDQTFKRSINRFKEDVTETNRLSKLAQYSYVFKPLYVS
jgi:hypothetical protein